MPGAWPPGYSVAVRAPNMLALRCIGCDRDIHEAPIVADDLATAVESLRVLAWAVHDDEATNRAAIESRRAQVALDPAPVYTGHAELDEEGKIATSVLPAGAGGSHVGLAVVDFGAFPGAPAASVTVSGQTDIAALSVITAQVTARATADHSADEHLVESVRVLAGSVSPGDGFVIHAFNTAPGVTRLYGAFNVAWTWS